LLLLHHQPLLLERGDLPLKLSTTSSICGHICTTCTVHCANKIIVSRCVHYTSQTQEIKHLLAVFGQVYFAVPPKMSLLQAFARLSKFHAMLVETHEVKSHANQDCSYRIRHRENQLISHTMRAALIARRAARIPHTVHIDTKQAKRRGKTRGNQPSLRSLRPYLLLRRSLWVCPPRHPHPPCGTGHFCSSRKVLNLNAGEGC